jgi:hypothetical protein
MALSVWLSALALAVSVTHAVTSSYAWWRDRKNLRVTATWRYWGMPHEELPNDPFRRRAPVVTIVNRSTMPITIENATVGAYKRGGPSNGFVWAISSRSLKYIHADKTVELPTLLGPGEMVRLDFPAMKEFVSERDKWRFGVALVHSLNDKGTRLLLPQ